MGNCFYYCTISSKQLSLWVLTLVAVITNTVCTYMVYWHCHYYFQCVTDVGMCTNIDFLCTHHRCQYYTFCVLICLCWYYNFGVRPDSQFRMYFISVKVNWQNLQLLTVSPVCNLMSGQIYTTQCYHNDWTLIEFNYKVFQLFRKLENTIYITV